MKIERFKLINFLPIVAVVFYTAYFFSNLNNKNSNPLYYNRSEVTDLYNSFSSFMSHARIGSIRMANAQLSESKCLNSKFFGTQIQNAQLDQFFATSCEFIEVDLSNSNLRGAVLKYVNLIESNLSHADIRGLKGRMVKFSKSNMQNTDMRFAVCTSCDFSFTDLRGADLRNSEFPNAIFINAIYDKNTQLPFDNITAKAYGLIQNDH